LKNNNEKLIWVIIHPLSNEESCCLQKLFKQIIQLPLSGSDHKIYNASGTLIANGYNRIVIGDFGAYLEFSDAQVEHSAFRLKWPGKPKRPVKYIWMITVDDSETKIYYQQRKVTYADYLPGMYYMSYFDAV